MRVRVLPVVERASCESECSRGAFFVLALYGMGRGRGVPIMGASYESEVERSRGIPLSLPRTRRTLCMVEVCYLLLWFNHFVFSIDGCGYPHTVGTDSSPRAFG
jgi:hypothetical protein